MDASSYAPLLERTRLPQPSLQRFAVTQIFQKLRSAPSNLGPESEPGREAIAHCLTASSYSPAVVDQAVRELCKLVAEDSDLSLSWGLMELQSALEGCEPRYVDLFVKGIGFLVRVGFLSRSYGWKFEGSERHPFLKVLLCRKEVHHELIRQVSVFVIQNKQHGMEKACEFLRPFMDFSVLRIPFSESSSVSFLRQLVSSLVSLCCSIPSEAVPIFKLLMSCFRYLPCKTDEDFKNYVSLAELMVDAHVVVLRHLVKMGSTVQDAQVSGVKLLDVLLALCSDSEKPNSVTEPIIELSRSLLGAQKELGLPYLPDFLSPMLSLFVILNRLDFEHEQLCVLKLLTFIFEWRIEDAYIGPGVVHNLSETLIFVLPIINLMTSTSKSIKGAATNLLLMLEKLPVNFLATSCTGQSTKCRSSSVSSPRTIIFRLLECLWPKEPSSVAFFLRISSTSMIDVKDRQTENEPKLWINLVGEFASCIAERQKMSFSTSSTSSPESMITETPLMLSALTGVMLLHQSLGSFAVHTLSAVATLEPKLGVTFLLTVLYYLNFLRDKFVGGSDLMLKLMGMLPALVSHNAMVPLIVQTIKPMLHKNSDVVLYATALRLLCKAWEINDRIFGSLQDALLPEKFKEFAYDRTTSVSMAASICDICKRNPDRGVDLILSVSECIESRDPAVQVLGFHSLGHLCEADVVDFYTAWIVISKYVLDYTTDAMIARSLCSLLRWGAMDAEAYPDASENILQILWDIASSSHGTVELAWATARASAFEALSHFEVPQVESNIQDFKDRIFKYLIFETDMDVLRAVEQIQDNVIAHEHKTRRRFVKEKRVSRNKIEKLLDVFPHVVFRSGKMSDAQELPGAALICLSFYAKDVDHKRQLKVVLLEYDEAAKEIAASLHLSRNIVIALIALESWKPFMQRWIRAYVTFLDSTASSTILDKTSKAASVILKKLIQMAEDAIPRSAENMALAVGALCAALPASVHTVKATALKFLWKWLHQSEHEHRQWSAAVSIGLISSSVHVTDRRKKLDYINGLVQVACTSKSIIVKGACSVGLGFACQDLCRTGSTSDERAFYVQELNLLGKIIRSLSRMISQLSQTSCDLLQNLSLYVPPGADSVGMDVCTESMFGNFDKLDQDTWGVAGIILGLGGSVSALYRAGSLDIIHNIKSLLTSWITFASSQAQIPDGSHILLSTGACLGLPTVVSFCRKLDLLHDNELHQLVLSYKQVMSTLLQSQMSTSLHQSLLTTSCVGAGNLLACVLDEGMNLLEAECVKELLGLFRKTYSGTYPHIVHFGGMLGVVNAMGAGAGSGSLYNYHHSKTAVRTVNEKMDSSKIMDALLSNSFTEPDVTSLMQDIFLVAQNSDDHQLQQYAAWAASFLRHHLHCEELQNSFDSLQNDDSIHKPHSQSFPEDSAVMKLSMWLMRFDSSVIGGVHYVNTIATILRCLSRAPRLPTLDWVVVIRRCMRYGAEISEASTPDPCLGQGKVQEECLHFLLVHANKFDSILSYLDELSDLPRFRMLDLNLQSYLLLHVSDLLRLFSNDRLKKLFSDLVEYLSSPSSSYQSYSSDQKCLLRVSCWKGLHRFLDDESLIETSEFFLPMEHCIEVLFLELPRLAPARAPGGQDFPWAEEWSEAIKCLGKARSVFVLDLLKVSDVHLVQRGENFSIAAKKIQARAQLVRRGFLPLTELRKIEVSILSTDLRGMWDVLVEVVAAMQHAEGSSKRQWLLDVLEISCVTKHPSTALHFLALLSGSFCKYMPMLILDETELLCDLPVTLASLLSSPRWNAIAESAVSYLWASTERIYAWATASLRGIEARPSTHSIDESQSQNAELLMHVMLETCVALKDHLPLEIQLRLASMVSSC